MYSLFVEALRTTDIWKHLLALKRTRELQAVPNAVEFVGYTFARNKINRVRLIGILLNAVEKSLNIPRVKDCKQSMRFIIDYGMPGSSPPLFDVSSNYGVDMHRKNLCSIHTGCCFELLENKLYLQSSFNYTHFSMNSAQYTFDDYQHSH